MIDRALLAKRESKSIDFKRSFDPESAGEWCELVKDLVAMANSGGGWVVIGVEDGGGIGPPGAAGPLLRLDPARITDKVAKYTGVQFDDFGIAEGVRDGQPVGVIEVGPASKPLVFEKPGTYTIADNKQKTAFSLGTLYVRHGAKSEPATTADVARILEKVVNAVRKEWMAGVRRVVSAPAGSQVQVLPPSVRQSTDPDATPIRITNDPNAPEYRLVEPDITHPWRQKELIAEIHRRLPPEARVNQFDIQAVRHVYSIESEARYYYKGRFATAQYSREFCDWIVGEYNADPTFFSRARDEFARRRSQ